MGRFSLLISAVVLFSTTAYADLSCKYQSGPTTLKIEITGNSFLNETIRNTRYPTHTAVAGVVTTIDSVTLLLRGTQFIEVDAGLQMPDESAAILHLSSDLKSATLEVLNEGFTAADFSCQ